MKDAPASWITHPAAGLGVLLLALIPRVFNLGTHGLWGDEAYDLGVVVGTLDGIWSGALPPDHVPGYFIMLWTVLHLVGDSEWVLRFPSALAGAVAALGVWAIGRELRWRSGAVAAAAVTALSPFAVFWSQQVKPEALAMAIAVWSTFLLLVAWRRGRARLWVAYALLNLVGLYVFYFHVFILAAHSFTVLTWCARQREWRLAVRWLTLQSLLCIALLPWLWAGLTRDLVGEVVRAHVTYSTADYLRASAYALLAGDPSAGLLAKATLSLMAGILVFGLIRGREAWLTFELGVIAAWLLVPLAGAYALELAIPAYETRYLLIVVPAFGLLLGFCLEQLLKSNQLLRAAAIVCVTYLVMFWFSKNIEFYSHPLYAHGYREAATYFANNKVDSGVILGLRGEYELRAYNYYLHEAGHYITTSPSLVNEQLHTFHDAGYQGVWFTSYTVSPRNSPIEQALEAATRPTDLISEYHDVRMQYYSFRPESALATSR